MRHIQNTPSRALAATSGHKVPKHRHHESTRARTSAAYQPELCGGHRLRPAEAQTRALSEQELILDEREPRALAGWDDLDRARIAAAHTAAIECRRVRSADPRKAAERARRYERLACLGACAPFERHSKRRRGPAERDVHPLKSGPRLAKAMDRRLTGWRAAAAHWLPLCGSGRRGRREESAATWVHRQATPSE